MGYHFCVLLFEFYCLKVPLSSFGPFVIFAIITYISDTIFIISSVFIVTLFRIFYLRLNLIGLFQLSPLNALKFPVFMLT
jgi:hypothetical protein